MSQPTRVPRPYRAGLIARLMEGLRYGGGIGQWSWLVHRLTGLGILFFLIIHVLDTFFVVFSPALYDHTVALYGGIWFNGQYYAILRWGFRFGELGLIASVVFHAINGLGVILYDFWKGGTAHRKGILKGVQIVFWVIMLFTTPYVLYPLTQPPQHMEDVQTDITNSVVVAPGAPTVESTKGALEGVVQAPRSAMLMFGMMGVAFVWLTALAFVPPAGTRVKPASGLELRSWFLMRISGLLLVLLAVGHLFIMHILNNVETIRYAFVASRWDAPGFAGPFWRMWDFTMITLALGHGFNGLRQVLHEYVVKPGKRVVVSTLIWLTAVTLIGIGSYAIFMFKTNTEYVETHPMKNRPPHDVSRGPGPTLGVSRPGQSTKMLGD